MPYIVRDFLVFKTEFLRHIIMVQYMDSMSNLHFINKFQSYN